MKTYLAAAATAVLLGATAVQAADAPLIIDETAIEMASPTFWDGFYAGLGVTGAYFAPATETYGFIDGYVGYNVSAENFVFGAEAWLSGWRSNLAGPAFSGGAEVRAGYLVTPGALAYASVGAMNYFVANGNTYGLLGLGVEFAVTEDVSVDLEYKHWMQIGGTNQQDSVSASVLWHF